MFAKWKIGLLLEGKALKTEGYSLISGPQLWHLTITATGRTSGSPEGRKNKSDIIEMCSSWFHFSKHLNKKQFPLLAVSTPLGILLKLLQRLTGKGLFKRGHRTTQEPKKNRGCRSEKGPHAFSRKYIKRSHTMRLTEPPCIELFFFFLTTPQCFVLKGCVHIKMFAYVTTLLCLDGWQDILQNSERLSVVISLSF